MNGIGRIILIAVVILGYLIWQKRELKKFRITEYCVTSDKIKKEAVLVVLADLHGFEYGERNQELLQKIREAAPDYILIAGDLIVSKYPDSYRTAYQILAQLVTLAPVYYTFGNHESRVNAPGLSLNTEFVSFIQSVKALGVVILNNETVALEPPADNLCLHGLEIDLKYYEKRRDVQMPPDYLRSCLPPPTGEQFHILLAHHPAYCEEYAAWGADLILCGHNHGGLINLPGLGSVFSPQLTLFPRYNAGRHQVLTAAAIISRGLGTHTYHIRINNRAELVVVKLKRKAKEK